MTGCRSSWRKTASRSRCSTPPSRSARPSETEWFATPKLATHAAEQLQDFDAVWCAPGSPYLSLDGALEGIRFAREARRPFLGTCAGFQHGVIEFARNVLGAEHAHHAEWGPGPAAAPLFIDELLCSLVGQAMQVHIVDDATRDLYGRTDVVEQYYCRFGLNEQHLPALRAAGTRGRRHRPRRQHDSHHATRWTSVLLPHAVRAADVVDARAHRIPSSRRTSKRRSSNREQ